MRHRIHIRLDHGLGKKRGHLAGVLTNSDAENRNSSAPEAIDPRQGGGFVIRFAIPHHHDNRVGELPEFRAGKDPRQGDVHGGSTAAGLAERIDSGAAAFGIRLAVGRENLDGCVVESPQGQWQTGAEANLGKKHNRIVGGIEALALHGARAIKGQDHKRVEAGVLETAFPDLLTQALIRLGLHRRAHIHPIAMPLIFYGALARGGLEEMDEFLGEGIDQGG